MIEKKNTNHNSKFMETSQNIIKNLTSRSKPNFSQISKELKITRKTLSTYFDEMKENKIIRQFTVNINPNIRPKLNYVLMEIKTNPQEPHLVEQLKIIPQIVMLDGIFGEFSLVALFIFKDAEEFNRVLIQMDSIMAHSYFKKYQIIETIKVYKTNGIKLENFPPRLNSELDDLDYMILDILRNEQGFSPLSTYEIKDLLHDKYESGTPSQSTIFKRIKRLKKANILLNYAINFCPSKIGYQGKYIVRIKPKDPSKYDHIVRLLEKNNNITDLFRIGEQYGLIAIVRMKNVRDYGEFIKILYETNDIEDTWTNFVLDELIPYTNFLIN